ncbi:MAG: histidine--tRNA ligase [Ferruginibacter sp.]
MSKPSIPQGTRDFYGETLYKRNFILQTIKNVFELYGFQPLETPAMENLETLMGKYGDEGDKLIFKILNNGLADPKNIEKTKQGFKKILDGRNSEDISSRALKYDLTIPFARFVAMNYGQLNFPFKRYQVQPVWRADRPQKGRYREFTQCDADVVGSKSLINEIELAGIYHKAFNQLGLKEYALHINNRKILAGLAEICHAPDKMIDISIAIDKLDKIGLEKVKEELQQRGFENEQVSLVEKYLLIAGNNASRIESMKKIFANNETALKGIEELEFIITHCGSYNIIIDGTLARGLNYYTGIIFEAKAPANVKMGSIGGGGRYDDLTGSFGVPDIAGVGISFGVDRIYDVMDELDIFPAKMESGTTALFMNMGSDEALSTLKIMQVLREEGISCELYHEQAKMDKQFKYASKKNIRYAVIIGSREITEGKCSVKHLLTSSQEEILISELSSWFKKELRLPNNI